MTARVPPRQEISLRCPERAFVGFGTAPEQSDRKN